MKSIHFLFLWLLLTFFTTTLQAQGAAILRNLVRGEQQVAKTVIREEAEALAKASTHVVDDASLPAVKSLAASKSLSDGVTENVQKFCDYYENGSKILDVHSSLGEQIKLDDKKKNRLNEIHSNVLYPKLYQAICKKLNRDTVSIDEADALLLGFKINGIGIDSNKLYNLYFTFSNSFAKEELEKLKIYYNCDENKNKEIEALAQRRNIILDKNQCKSTKSVNSDLFNFFIGIPISILLGFLIYRGYTLIKNLYKK